MHISLLAVLALSTLTVGVLDCPRSPNCVSSLADDPDRRIMPLHYPDGEREKAMLILLELLRDLPRTKVIHQDETIIRAVVSSALFRFKDDLEFHFDPTAPRIHLRSASRRGYWDLGVNRSRIERLREIFARKMQNT